MKQILALICFAALLTGCAGTLTLTLPDGARLTSTRDTTIGGIHVAVTKDGYTVDVTNYIGRATEPMDAQTRQIKAIGDAATQVIGAASATAAKSTVSP